MLTKAAEIKQRLCISILCIIVFNFTVPLSTGWDGGGRSGCIWLEWGSAQRNQTGEGGSSKVVLQAGVSWGAQKPWGILGWATRHRCQQPLVLSYCSHLFFVPVEAYLVVLVKVKTCGLAPVIPAAARLHKTHPRLVCFPSYSPSSHFTFTQLCFYSHWRDWLWMEFNPLYKKKIFLRVKKI